jgi:hypothetical protein
MLSVVTLNVVVLNVANDAVMQCRYDECRSTLG